MGKIIDKIDDKTIDKLNIGMSRSFRVFGGIGLLISIWVNNELGLKISLVTFIFGGLAKIIEMLNKKIKESVGLQIIIWSIFIILYILVIIVIYNWEQILFLSRCLLRSFC